MEYESSDEINIAANPEATREGRRLICPKCQELLKLVFKEDVEAVPFPKVPCLKF
jgi:C4-type Zn-finger protein